MTALSLLTALSVLITTLKAIPGLASEVGTWIQVAEDAILNATAAHKKAQTAVDPAQLTPETPVTPGVDPNATAGASSSPMLTSGASGTVAEVAKESPTLPPGAPVLPGS